jgi:histidine ammonia-lyase
MRDNKRVCVNVSGLDIRDVVAVARYGARVELGADAISNINRARKWVETIVSQEKPVYGITTGLGDLCRIRIEADQRRELSSRIIMSHACGVGDPLSEEEVRAIMFCQILNFSHGHSGVRLEVVQTLVEMLNRQITPWVPSQGSVGYLTHMAHIALVTIGLGQAYYHGELLPGSLAMERAGLRPIQLVEKEGLSLVNGTPCMTGIGALAVYDAQVLARWADVVASLSLEALAGSSEPFDERVQNVRPFKGQAVVANNVRRMISGSDLVDSNRTVQLQDPLSLRAIPQVHGACRDQIEHVVEVITTEMRSATDNPLVFDDGNEPVAISSCNAHGEPVALATDILCLAVAELASISERRQHRLLNPYVSNLPAFLIDNSGLNTGFMITQYVSASLVAENKVLAHPISVDSIMTSALQEDHVSMGTPAAIKARQVTRNSQKVLAVELLLAGQALDFHRNSHTFGKGTSTVYGILRERVEFRSGDREFSGDLLKVISMIENPSDLAFIEKSLGVL